MKCIKDQGIKAFESDFDYSSCPVLFEADVSVCDVVRHNGKIYSVCMTNKGQGYAGVKEIKIDMDAEETNYKRNLVCPVCGWENNDSWELDDSDDAYECGCCGAVLEYTREVKVTYNAKVVKRPEIKETKAEK